MAAKKQFLLLILQFTLCQSLDIITTNQSFKEGDFLVSKNNRFAFGFFCPGSSSYRYLGIWFHEIPEKSVVWVANRNNPITGLPGVLSINEFGNLVIYDDADEKFQLWSTNVSVKATDPCFAKLLDSGNLILFQGTSKRTVWQSFDNPIDTQLPGMRIAVNQKTGQEWSLTSWRSEDDPATGEYSVKINPIGEPQIFVYKGSRPHWRANPWPLRKFSSSLYNYSFVVSAEEVCIIYSINLAPIRIRVMVDPSGLFKWLSWHESDGKWKELWSVPKYPCDMYARCGPYGECSPSNPDVFECSCLPGYEPKSRSDWDLRDASKGCVRKRLQSSSVCRNGEGFVKVENVKFPDTSEASMQMNLTALECETECLKNCSCTAYASIQNDESRNGCLTWYGELLDTVDHMEGQVDLYVRVDFIELDEKTIKSNVFLRKGLKILISSVTLAWLTIIFFAYLFIRRRIRGVIKNKRFKRLFDPISGSIYYKNTLVASELRQSNPPDIEFFELSTIVAATDNFSPANKIGQGGFGSVYKGQLPNGQEVAVKQLSKNSEQGTEEFKNEVMLIAKLQHKNLVKLLGCCIEGGEKLLIYEYLPNISLDSFLSDHTRRSFLDWRKRHNIIMGIARGILYLHQDSRLTIIHRDLKCSNILLDADLNPKVSDFGMARIFRGDQFQEKTNKVVGTYGYMSPEYAVFGKFSTKSDEYSFGVILLEILSAKKNNGFHGGDTSLSLIGHVWELWRQDKEMEIIDFSLELSYPPY